MSYHFVLTCKFTSYSSTTAINSISQSKFLGNVFTATQLLAGFDVKYGARPLRRAIQTKIEDKLAEAVLDGMVKRGDTVSVRLKGKEIALVQVTRQSKSTES